MIDIKTLLPEVSKLVPGVAQQELIDGIKQFAKTHPDFTNQQALQALAKYLQQTQAQVPAAPPFKNLLNTIGAR